jgi:hypothetical protein
MLVSEYYKIGRTQASLDFVDVHVANDLPVFVDPRALRLMRSPWSESCVTLLQHFFRTVIAAIREKDFDRSNLLLSQLREPRETRLGVSRQGNRGRAMGTGLARDVSQALSKSRAAATGLLQDLEDTILMVDNISHDIVSDIATNIIRRPLIEYTQSACTYHGIDMAPQVDSGPMWDPASSEWYNELVSLPTIDDQKLLLVPKSIVRRVFEYNVEEYHNDYILEYLRQRELNDPQSTLVKLLKTRDERIVTDKALIEKYGRGKGMILDLTVANPEILQKYRHDREATPRGPLTNDQLMEVEGRPPVAWDELFASLHVIPTGRDHAGAYENAVESLLTALLYPALTQPQVQFRIHEGRKRIDIAYTNCAAAGFFEWAGKHYRCPMVFVECKNYAGEIANPELDQLAGRFSQNRGQLGLLVVREFDDKAAFLKRCRDTAQDGRGFILALDDGDLQQLVTSRRAGSLVEFPLLIGRFQSLIA